jgi:hypothetical protein
VDKSVKIEYFWRISLQEDKKLPVHGISITLLKMAPRNIHMTEPTIICPSCKTEMKLTESLAAPLLESTRLQYEQKISQKEAEVSKREEEIRVRQETLVKAQNSLQ